MASIDLRVGKEGDEVSFWSVVADLSLTTVLMLVLLVLVQFLATFRESRINQELQLRQHEMKVALNGISTGSIGIDSIAPDRQRLTFANQLLFESCDVTLHGRGRELLRKVGSVIRDRQNYFESIHVEGHADARSTGGAACPYASNWELSSQRATAVVRILADSAALDPRMLSATGRAEFHPI